MKCLRYSKSPVLAFKTRVNSIYALPVCHSMKGSIASTRAVAAETFKGTEFKHSYASCASTVGVANGAVASAAEALRLTTAQGLPVLSPHLRCQEANTLWVSILPETRIESFMTDGNFLGEKEES